MNDELTSVTDSKKISVLIADAESLLRQNLALIFKNKPYEYEVFTAKDGLEVIQILKDNDIDLLLINSILPKVNGIDICSLIRKAEKKEIEKISENHSFCDIDLTPPTIKYIYIISFIESASATDDRIIEEIVGSGADDFIFKPFSIELLRSKINSAERIIGLQNEIKRIYSTIHMLSTTDTLTKIWNRRTIISKLKKTLCLSIREYKSVGIFMIDIDHFKKINDTYGHLFGDTVLREVAQTIKNKNCRMYDEIGRYGGEEFLLVTPLYSSSMEHINYKEGYQERLNVIKSISERILTSIANTKFIYKDEKKKKEVTVKTTVSIGAVIADFTRPKEMPEKEKENNDKMVICKSNNEIDKLTDSFLKKADEALYQAKEGGRNRCVIYGDEQKET